MDLYKICEQRLLDAEGVLDEVNQRLMDAQTLLGCIVGLGSEYKNISTLREKVKGVAYSIGRRRESATCELDSTMTHMLQNRALDAREKKKRKAAR